MKWEEERVEEQFYHKSALDTKRKYKVLKLALARLQQEYDDLKKQHTATKEDLNFRSTLQRQTYEVL